MSNQSDPKIVRAWCDGCYDMVHIGHANSLRQAKGLADKLIVGIHSDAEITKHKGPPVFSEEERYKMVRGIKWVDEVIKDVPYETTLQTLDCYNCDFCVHGNDLTLTKEGNDCYGEVKKAKRYREVMRTAGISTTDLVNRILFSTRNYLIDEEIPFKLAKNTSEGDSIASEDLEFKSAVELEETKLSTNSSPWTGHSQFLLTTQKILEFTEIQAPKPGDKIIYVAGAFDLFHVGHMDFLEKAKSLGDYLIVGLHDDPTVSSYKGKSFPIMTLYERVWSVLACKFVNDVIIGAPYCIDSSLIKQFKINVVCHGKLSITSECCNIDPYEIPKNLNILQVIDSNNDLTTEKIVERIIRHRFEYTKRNEEKELKEIQAYEAFKLSNTYDPQYELNQN